MTDDKGDGSECHQLPMVTFRTVPFVIHSEEILLTSDFALQPIDPFWA